MTLQGSRFMLIAAAAIVLAGCEREGPAERAGERLDNAIEDVRDRFEDAREDVEDAIEDAREALEDE